MVHSNSWTQVQTGQQGGEKEQSSLKQRLQGRGWLSWSAKPNHQETSVMRRGFPKFDSSCLSAVILVAISVCDPLLREFLVLGKTSHKKECFLSGIARIRGW